MDLLATYNENDDSVNHYIVKWFYRVAHDHHMHAMLYQLRLFLIFNKILNEPPVDRFKVSNFVNWCTVNNIKLVVIVCIYLIFS